MKLNTQVIDKMLWYIVYLFLSMLSKDKERKKNQPKLLQKVSMAKRSKKFCNLLLDVG